MLRKPDSARHLSRSQPSPPAPMHRTLLSSRRNFIDWPAKGAQREKTAKPSKPLAQRSPQQCRARTPRWPAARRAPAPGRQATALSCALQTGKRKRHLLDVGPAPSNLQRRVATSEVRGLFCTGRRRRRSTLGSSTRRLSCSVYSSSSSEDMTNPSWTSCNQENRLAKHSAQ